MKAGFIQYSPVFCDFEKNLQTLDKLLEKAPQADFLVLPELCNSGYNFESRQQAFDFAQNPTQCDFVDLLHRHCKKRKMFIASGFNERDGDKLYNSSVLVGPEGYMGKYRKIHLFLNEKDIFTPGEGDLPVFDTPVGKIGMLICFDWVFPEVWRIMALKGAEIIAHCSNLVLPGFAQRSVPVHALVNRFFVITANRIGSERELTFTGLSTIADPRGNVMCQAKSDSTEAQAVDFDLELARDKMITARNDLLGDRRPEIYRQLIDKF